MHPLQPKEHTVKKREWKITARATDTFGLQMCSDEVCSILDRGRNQKVTFPLLFSTLAVNATLWLKTQQSTEGLRLKPQHTQPMHCSSHVGFLLFFKWFFWKYRHHFHWRWEISITEFILLLCFFKNFHNKKQQTYRCHIRTHYGHKR